MLPSSPPATPAALMLVLSQPLSTLLLTPRPPTAPQPPPPRAAAELVCRRWRDVAASPELWAELDLSSLAGAGNAALLAATGRATAGLRSLSVAEDMFLSIDAVLSVAAANAPTLRTLAVLPTPPPAPQHSWRAAPLAAAARPRGPRRTRANPTQTRLHSHARRALLSSDAPRFPPRSPGGLAAPPTHRARRCARSAPSSCCA